MNPAASKMTRVGRPKSAEKRSAVIHAAGELFLAEGYERTSMDAIAAAAGVSKQTVYSHFQNKYELFRACIDHKCHEYELSLDPARRGMPLREGLIAVGERYLRLIADPQVIAMWRLMVSEALVHPRVAAMFYETGPERTCTNIGEFLRRHAEQGNIAIDDVGEAAQVFLALLRGDYHNRLMTNLAPILDDAERRKRAERIAEMFVKLYRP